MCLSIIPRGLSSAAASIVHLSPNRQVGEVLKDSASKKCSQLMFFLRGGIVSSFCRFDPEFCKKINAFSKISLV